MAHPTSGAVPGAGRGEGTGRETALREALEDVAEAERSVSALKERARVARARCSHDLRRAGEARAARQEAFARGLLDAAHAHEVAAREAEARLADAERRREALRARVGRLCTGTAKPPAHAPPGAAAA